MVCVTFTSSPSSQLSFSGDLKQFFKTFVVRRLYADLKVKYMVHRSLTVS